MESEHESQLQQLIEMHDKELARLKETQLLAYKEQKSALDGVMRQNANVRKMIADTIRHIKNEQNQIKLQFYTECKIEINLMRSKQSELIKNLTAKLMHLQTQHAIDIENVNNSFKKRIDKLQRTVEYVLKLSLAWITTLDSL